MDDAFLVRSFERIGDLLGVVQRSLERQRPLERLALDQLHHQRALFHAVDLRDVGMIERRPAPRLRAGSGPCAPGSLREGSGNTLIATSRSSLVSLRAVHLAHATRADGGEDFIGAEFRACGQRHRV